MIAIAVAAAACLAMRSAGTAPAAVADSQAVEIVPAAPPAPRAPSVVADTAARLEPAGDGLLINHVDAADSATSWFAASELDLNALRDKSNMRVDRGGSCLYLDRDVPGLGEGNKDCRVLNPGADGSAIFTLPMLAVLGWVLAILAVAGGYHLYRRWQTRRWLHRLRAQGIVPLPVNRRGDHAHRASRSRTRKSSASRSRAA